MILAEIHSSAEWNTALATLPNAHVLQTWEWGQLKTKVGWTATRLLFIENGRAVAGAQILRRPLRGTPFGVLYVPKGPVLDYQNTALFDSVLDRLEQFARRSRAIFVKVDPDVVHQTAPANCLSQRAWRVSSEQIQYRNTVVLDLTKSEQELYSDMKPKWRYNVRLSEKKGVRIELGTEADLPLFYDLYAETGARDGFLIRRFPYYREVWSTMLQGHLAQMFLARVGNETIAGLILFVFSKRAWYFYGASRSTQRDLMPNHLLQWEAIRWAKKNCCREYDFWGAPDRLTESDPMYGVYKFKLGFGGEFVERIPAHDFVAGPILYWLYSVVRPRYLARLRRRHSTQMGAE